MIVSLSSCVREVVYVQEPLITDADLFYEYSADRYGVVVDGELFNDGETYIEAVQLEVNMYDIDGFLIATDFVWINVFLNSGEVSNFYFTIPQRGVWDVQILIHRYD